MFDVQRVSFLRRVGLPAIMAVGLLLGCAGGDASSGSDEQPAAQRAEPLAPAPQEAPTAKRAAPVACELVSPEEIGELIGRTVQATLPTEDPLYCLWSTRAAPGIVGDVRVSLDPDPIDPQGAIDRMIERGATRVPGLAVDAALELRRNPDFYKLMIHRGDLVVEVVVFGNPPSLDAEMVIALARLVNDRL